MANERPRTEMTSPQTVTFEAVMPADMAMRAEESGIKRAALNPLAVFVLSLLGGAFVAFGAIFATTVSAGKFTSLGGDGGVQSSPTPPFGIVRLFLGLA